MGKGCVTSLIPLREKSEEDHRSIAYLRLTFTLQSLCAFSSLSSRTWRWKRCKDVCASSEKDDEVFLVILGGNM